MRPLLATLTALLIALPTLAEDGKKKEKLVSPAFEEALLADVLEWLRKEAGFEYTLSKAAQAVAKKGLVKVTVVATEVTPREALKQTLEPLGLAYAEKVAGQIRIMTSEEYEKDLVLELYDVREMLVEVKDFEGPESRGWGRESKRDQEFPGGVHFDDPGEEGEQEGAPKPMSDPERLPALVKDATGGEKAWVEGTSVTLRNGVLYVRAPQKLQEAVRDVLARMRQMK